MKKRWVFLILVIAVVLAAAAIAQTTGSSTTTTGAGTSAASTAAKQCNDQIDNDEDGLIDYPADFGCTDANDNNETDITINPLSAMNESGIRRIYLIVSPTIDVVFSEFIKLDSAYLYAINDETTAMMAIGMAPPSIPLTTTNLSNTIIAKPQVNLFNGLYDLVLTVQDLVGNSATVHQKFIIDAPGTDINIVEPRLGVSNGAAENLTIVTTRKGMPENTLCKITTSPFVYDFESSALVPFDLEWNSRHTFRDFFKNANFGGSAVFYILCKDTALQRVNRQRFEIYIDPTPPGITSFEFNPKKIVEYPEFETKMWVILNVTANEPVICRYSNESRDYEQMARFPGFDLNNFNSYTKNNNTVKVYLPDASPANHDFYVQCEDKAGWRTEVMKKTLQVDLSAGLGIDVIEPMPFTTNKSITLKMTTVKRALCVIGNSTSDYRAMGTDTTGKNHAYYLGQFGDGRYTYSIKCTSQAVGGLFVQEQELSYAFVVDNTKPSAPNITGSKNTCFQDKFIFIPPIAFSATDLESGIDSYLYKLESGSAMIMNWTRTKGDLSTITKNQKGEDLNLSKTASYKLSAKAVNGAGTEGPEASMVITHNPDDINCFEKNPPIITLAKNQTEGKTIVEVVCKDESGCDNNSYYYGLCDAESCETSTKLDYPFMITVYDTKYLAYNVSDIRGYSARGTEKIEVKNADTCDNKVKDGEETDVDCGGKCSGCGAEKACIVNKDCSSNSCINGTCIEPRCDDNITNGPYGNEETDVDCGGYCSATCNINQTCNNNGDCLSGFCNPKEKKCNIATCDDGYKNGNETGIDCGGECPAQCGDTDNDSMDDGWEVKYCNGHCDPEEDMDKDGLTNLREFQLRTDPTKWDTDDDSYSDGEEVAAGTDPLDPSSYPKSTAGILLIVFGLFLILGGTGYLAYKKYYVQKPVPSAKMPPLMPMAGTQTPEQRRISEEQQRIMLEQRRREMEERQKRYEELRARIMQRRRLEEAKKKEERESLFRKFGSGPGATPKKEGVSRIEIKPRIILPKSAISKAQPAQPARQAQAVQRARPQEAAKTAKKTEEPEEFSKLEELTKSRKEGKKEGVFEEMEEAVKGGNAAEKGEDVYKKLDEVSSSGGKPKKARR